MATASELNRATDQADDRCCGAPEGTFQTEFESCLGSCRFGPTRFPL